MKTEDQLKPCPFCGEKAEMHEFKVGKDKEYYVYCSTCHAHSRVIQSKTAVVVLWNVRSDEATVSRAILSGNKNTEIERCPFCGFTIMGVSSYAQKEFTIVCESCEGASGDSNTLKETLSLWNRRAPRGPLMEKVTE